MEYIEEETNPTETTSEPEKKEDKPNFLVKWLRYKNKNTRLFFLLACVLLGLSGCVASSYFCIYKWLPELWHWGFNPTTWRSIFSVLGAIYLVIGGIFPFFLVADTIHGIIGLFAEDAEKEFNDKLNEIIKKQNSYEDKLEANDDLGLIPLVTYSRIELEQYYKIGLTQTQKSYTYSIVAMWIGLLIIIFGIILYLFPSKITNQELTSGNFQILTIASGIFTEFISALFLWIYKSSVNNLTYFYNRQIFIHNTLLAYKISTSMKDGDLAKKIIVQKILDFGFKTHGNIFDKKSLKPQLDNNASS